MNVHKIKKNHMVSAKINMLMPVINKHLNTNYKPPYLSNKYGKLNYIN